MNPERDLLAVLRDTDRELEAPPEIEQRLLVLFRRKKRQRLLRRAIAWSAAAAAIVIAMTAYQRNQSVNPVLQPVQQTAAEAIQRPVPTLLSSGAGPRPATARKSARARPREVFTEFFPLLDPAPPIDRGELVRVNLPAAAMQSVGLPVREDRLSERVQADVLVSEEGLATAIRFVRINQ